MQGLIEYATACNFESIELIAQCIDTSVQNVHQKEYELAQRYLSVLSFYKKHNALPHPAGSTPNFNPNENVKDFYTPLIIPLTTDSQQDIIARLQSAKIKKQKKTTKLSSQPRIVFSTTNKKYNPYSLFFIYTYKQFFEKKS